MPNNTNEEWWWKEWEDFLSRESEWAKNFERKYNLLHGTNKTFSSVPTKEFIGSIAAESTRRARLEMARDMKDLVRQERRELPTDDGFWLACSDIMSKLDAIIQEEEDKK